MKSFVAKAFSRTERNRESCTGSSGDVAGWLIVGGAFRFQNFSFWCWTLAVIISLQERQSENSKHKSKAMER